MEVSNDPSRLREEVRYLRRRLQYLQSVSTVFRQRISLLLREVAEDPSRVRDLHAAYTALLSETALAEKQDSFDPNSSSSGGGGNYNYNSTVSSPSSAHSGGAGGAVDPVRARDDVRRAHHLCTILQERNELKKRELELEQLNRELMNRLDEYENPPKFNVGNASAAKRTGAGLTNPNNNNNNASNRMMFSTNTTNSRAPAGAGGLMNTPRGGAEYTDPASYDDQYQNANQNNNNNGGRSGSADSQSTAASSVIPGAALLRSLGGDPNNSNNNSSHAAALVATQKQNSFLKNRVQRLKGELEESLKAREATVMDLQTSLNQLNHQTQQLRAEASRYQREAAEANRAKLDSQKELLFQKSREELLLAKVNSGTALAVRNGGGSGYNNSNSMMMMTPESVAASSQLVQALSHQLQDRDQALAVCDSRINDLEDQLRDSEARRATKDVEIVALGAQIKGLRARLDTFDAERSSSQVQQSLIGDVHDRLLSAVTEMQRGASSESLARSLTDVSAKLDRLEALELQLRQKEDMLVLADDEVARSHSMQQQLKEALAAFSPLFLQLPKSADALERLVIERDELLAEIRKAASEARAPDLNSVEGRVELRTLQTNSQRGHPTSSALAGGNSSLSHGMPVVPPLPPLLDILAEAAASTRGFNHLRDGHSPSTQQQQHHQHQRSQPRSRPNIDAIPLSHLTPSDISATFRMFSPPGAAPNARLNGEPLRLCFAALGVQMPRAAAPTGGVDSFSMNESDLVAYIIQQQQ